MDGNIRAYLVTLRTPKGNVLAYAKLGTDLDEIAELNGMDGNSAMAEVLNVVRSGYEHGKRDRVPVNPDDMLEIKALEPDSVTGYTILRRDDHLGFDYYVYPEGETRVLLRNTASGVTKDVIVPANVARYGNPERAIKDLFRQIEREYAAAYRTARRGILDIPETFLSGYGVKPVKAPPIAYEIDLET